MYDLVGDDGTLYPADLNALTKWAQSGRLRPDSIVLDGATGRRLRADEFIALQSIFAARPPAPVRPTQPLSEVRPFAALPKTAADPVTPVTGGGNVGRNAVIVCLGLFAVLLFGGYLANLGSQTPSHPPTTPGGAIKQPTPPPLPPEVVAARKAQADEEKVDGKRRKAEAAQQKVEAVEQRKQERIAAAEDERKASEEYEKDGLVLLLKSVKSESDEYSTKIHGVIINRTGRQLSYAQVQFSLYDKSGAQVGTAMDNINNLDDGGRWKFEATTVQDNWRSYKFSDMTSL